MYDKKMCFKSTFISRLINKSTKTFLLKQKKYTRFLTPFYRKSKGEIVCHAFSYWNFVFERASNTSLKLFVKAFSTKRHVFLRDNVVK